ncbi:MAG TPA: porin [Thermodesulfobacteriota bacterium]|nr:porin [Thermodesulfobacteriota bacterium]
MRLFLGAGLAIAMLLTLPFAKDSRAQSASEQIKALKKQLEEIQKQNQQQIEELQQKIQDLEVKKEAEKEKIIEEIKAEQKDAWYNKIEVSYKKPGDGFTIKTKDGNFSLNMRLRAQFQFSVNDTTDELTATDFRIRRLRFYWIGNAFRPWFEYYIQVSADNGSDLQIRDAYFNAAYEKVAIPRVGQFKVPFNREELNSSSELQLVERSIVNEEFSLGRDIGPALYGLLGNYVTYGVGIFDGNGRNDVSTDSNLLYAGRIMLTPCCGELKYANSSFPIGGDYKIEPNFGEDKPLIAFGVAAAGMEGLNIDIKTPDASVDDRFEAIGITVGDFVQLTADANFKYKIFSIEGEYDARWISPDANQGVSTDTVFDQGFRLQSGVFLIPRLVEVAGRFSYIDFDASVPNIQGVDEPDNSWQITPGLNFYMSHSHKWKIQLDYSFIKNEFTNADDVDENIFRAQLQAYF